MDNKVDDQNLLVFNSIWAMEVRREFLVFQLEFLRDIKKRKKWSAKSEKVVASKGGGKKGGMGKKGKKK